MLAALGELSADWAVRDSKAHALLGRPSVQPTIIRGGAFISNVPESCRIDLNATYLPGDADEGGYGSVPREEILHAVDTAAGGDDWLADNPPAWTWATDYPPSEIDPGEDIVAVTREAATGSVSTCRARGSTRPTTARCSRAWRACPAPLSDRVTSVVPTRRTSGSAWTSSSRRPRVRPGHLRLVRYAPKAELN